MNSNHYLTLLILKIKENTYNDDMKNEETCIKTSGK